MAWYDKVVEFGKGVGDWAVETVSDIGAVGAQVLTTVGDTGVAALKGFGTAIADPGKFISDVGDNIATWGGHIAGSWNSGTAMIQEGWNDVQKGGSPGLMFVKTIGGLAQISSLGASDAIGEHLAETVEAETDEFGNVSGYKAKDGADAITRIMTKHLGSTVATTVNANNEIEEALDDGDAEKANQIFGDTMWVTVGRPVSKIAGVAGMVAGAAAIPFTGGTSAALVAASAALTFTSVTAGTVANSKESKFDAFNVEDDALDGARAEAEAMVAAGRLDESQVDKYVEIVQAVNANQTYKSLSPDYAEQQGFQDADEMKAFLLQANGLPSDFDAYGNGQAYEAECAVLAKQGIINEFSVEPMAELLRRGDAGEIGQRDLLVGYNTYLLDRLDMTDGQKAAYAGHMADVSMQGLDEDALMERLSSDPVLSEFFLDDGTFYIPEARGSSLIATVAEAEAGTSLDSLPAVQDEVQALENQAVMEQALAQMGYA